MLLVKCIDSGSYYLTVGKNYFVEKYDNNVFDYWIINDIGHKHGVEKELFILNVKEMRNEKLKKLGI
jgi:hypothetical protein